VAREHWAFKPKDHKSASPIRYRSATPIIMTVTGHLEFGFRNLVKSQEALEMGVDRINISGEAKLLSD